MKKISILMFLLLLVLNSSVFGADSKYEKILSKIDIRSNFKGNDFTALMTMISEDPEKGITKNVVFQYRRDQTDEFLMLIQEPKEKKGQGYLKSGDNMWMYDPESRTTSHISMKENFESTDAKNSDFRMSSYNDDYSIESVTEGKLGKFAVYIMELKAINDEVTYPFMTVYIDKDKEVLLKASNYSLTKRLMRTSYYSSYAKLGDSYIATEIIFKDELIKGKKTQISIQNPSIQRIDDEVFTKAYLERVAR